MLTRTLILSLGGAAALLLSVGCGRDEVAAPAVEPPPPKTVEPVKEPVPPPAAPPAAEVERGASPTLQAFLDGLSDEQKAKVNPLSGDATAIKKGMEEFQSTCFPCHGKTGDGDGPAAKALTPKPARLSDPMIAAAVTPGAQYAVLKQGIAGTGMAAFGAALSDEQIWRLVAYVETLSKPASEATPPAGG